MDETDKTSIFYNRPEVIMYDQVVQDDLGVLRVKGEGESVQEAQLQDSLGDGKYQDHKLSQKRSQK